MSGFGSVWMFRHFAAGFGSQGQATAERLPAAAGGRLHPDRAWMGESGGAESGRPTSPPSLPHLARLRLLAPYASEEDIWGTPYCVGPQKDNNGQSTNRWCDPLPCSHGHGSVSFTNGPLEEWTHGHGPHGAPPPAYL